MVGHLRIELRHSGLQPDTLPTELTPHKKAVAYDASGSLYSNSIGK